MYYLVPKMNNNKKEISLFGSGKEKILRCFYKNQAKEIYFSEILRDTKLTQNTTLKHLSNLKELGIINSTKKIGNTFYKINQKNPVVYSVFSYFDYDKLNKLPYTRRNAINMFLEKIQNKPLIAVVFGSTAKNTFNKESDIDLLLIYNKKESTNLKLKKETNALAGIKIQDFIIDFEYFKEQILKEEDNTIIHAIKTGFPIIGSYLFYKGVLNG